MHDMTTQTEAQKHIDYLEHWNPGDPIAAELRRLEAANKELMVALKMNAQALSWLAFGECRGFTDNLPTALEATSTARAAITKHGGAA